MATTFHFVTDQGSNIKAALNSKYNRLPCACHCISTALKHALPGGPGDKGDTEELQALVTSVDAVKALVRYVKKSGLNATLSKTLLQENDTRWNSMLMMLESVIEQEDEVKAKLLEKNEMKRMDNIDFDLLRNVVMFLKPLQQATKAVEGEHYATIHQVVLWKYRLMQHTVPHAIDCPTVAQLKSRLAETLPVKLEITIIHKLALFLHPQYKSLRKFSAVEKIAVHNQARKFVTTLQIRDEQRQRQAQLEQSANMPGTNTSIQLNTVQVLFTFSFLYYSALIFPLV